MGRAGTPRGLPCLACGGLLLPIPGGSPDRPRLVCAGCGELFRARRRDDPAGGPSAVPIGHLGLVWRGLALRGLEAVYRVGLCLGVAGLFSFGGFVPVLRAWLHDEIGIWHGAVEILGGVPVDADAARADADLGPVLSRGDATPLFEVVADVARQLGARPPRELRLTYLPCCGVLAWRRSEAMVVGLPLLDVLDVGELRAVLAHELSHLANGDATRAAASARFVEALGRSLRSGVIRRGPLAAWARACHRVGSRLIGPIALGQEVRADRASATVAGGTAAASALVKVAIVQPLFREVLAHYDPDRPDLPDLYSFFRAFWDRLPESAKAAMRGNLIAPNQGTAPDPVDDPTHPPLLDRLRLLQTYPDTPGTEADHAPAALTIGDVEALGQMLHNRLFALPAIEPTVYHRAGS